MIGSVQELLEQDEGRKPWPYTDTTGHKTWGIGHLLADPLAPNVIALLNQAIDLQFQHDMAQTEAGVAREFPGFDRLDPVRQAVLIDMAFNLGIGGLSTFTTFLGLMASGSWAQAATDLRTTAVYKELTTRYERLARMIETGEWPS